MTHDISVIEEIIRRTWPTEIRDASPEEESHWDIPNEDSSHTSFNRHWFKQNYSDRNAPDSSAIIYH